MKLNEKHLKECHDAAKSYAKKRRKILIRIEEILSLICKEFGGKLQWFDVETYHNEHEIFFKELPKDFLEMEVGTTVHMELDHISYNNGIPMSFLTMTDKQISKIVRKEIAEANRTYGDRDSL